MDELISYIEKYFKIKESSALIFEMFQTLDVTVVFCQFNVQENEIEKQIMLPLGYIYSVPEKGVPLLYTHTPVFDSKDGEACGFMSEFGLLQSFAEIPNRPFDAAIQRFLNSGGSLFTISYGQSIVNLIEDNGYDGLLFNLVLSTMHNFEMNDSKAKEHFVKEYYLLSSLPFFRLDEQLANQIIKWKSEITKVTAITDCQRMVQKLLPLRVIDKKTQKNPVSRELDLTLQVCDAVVKGLLDGFPPYIQIFRLTNLDQEVYANGLTRQRYMYGAKHEQMSQDAILIVMPYVGFTFYYYFLNHDRVLHPAPDKRLSFYEYDFSDMSTSLFIWFWELAMLHDQGIVHGDLHLNNITLRQMPARISDWSGNPIELINGYHHYRVDLESWYIPYNCKHPTIIDFSRSTTLDDPGLLLIVKDLLPAFYEKNQKLLETTQTANPVLFGKKVALLDQYKILDSILRAAEQIELKIDPLVAQLHELIAKQVCGLLETGGPATSLDIGLLTNFRKFREPHSPVYFVHPAASTWDKARKALIRLAPRKQVSASMSIEDGNTRGRTFDDPDWDDWYHPSNDSVQDDASEAIFE